MIYINIRRTCNNYVTIKFYLLLIESLGKDTVF